MFWFRHVQTFHLQAPTPKTPGLSSLDGLDPEAPKAPNPTPVRTLLDPPFDGDGLWRCSTRWQLRNRADSAKCEALGLQSNPALGFSGVESHSCKKLHPQALLEPCEAPTRPLHITPTVRRKSSGRETSSTWRLLAPRPSRGPG